MGAFMDWNNLAGALSRIGLTLLGSAIGGPAGTVVTTVGPQILDALGVRSPAEAVRTIEAHPDASRARLEPIERENREWLRDVLLAEAAHLRATTEAEHREAWWAWAWRPAMMWLIAFFWLWSIVLAPLVNAFVPTFGLPAPPYEMLMGLSTLYLALYMGGHTLKAVYGGKAAS